MEIRKTFISFQDPKLEKPVKINKENTDKKSGGLFEHLNVGDIATATTKSMGEEGGEQLFQLLEPQTIGTATTKSMGEEGGEAILNPVKPPFLGDIATATTKSMGEEGGWMLPLKITKGYKKEV